LLAIIRFKNFPFFIFLLSLLFSGVSYAKSNISPDVKLRLSILKTPVQNIHDFENPDKNIKWLDSRGKSIYLAQASGFSWVKIDLTNKTPAAMERLIEIANTELQVIDVYEYASIDKQIRILPVFENHTNVKHFTDRPINYRNLVYPIELEGKATRSFLFKVYHSYDVKLNFHVWDRSDFN